MSIKCKIFYHCDVCKTEVLAVEFNPICQLADWGHIGVFASSEDAGDAVYVDLCADCVGLTPGEIEEAIKKQVLDCFESGE